jgi:hypothetical protein
MTYVIIYLSDHCPETVEEEIRFHDNKFFVSPFSLFMTSSTAGKHVCDEVLRDAVEVDFC